MFDRIFASRRLLLGTHAAIRVVFALAMTGLSHAWLGALASGAVTRRGEAALGSEAAAVAQQTLEMEMLLHGTMHAVFAITLLWIGNSRPASMLLWGATIPAVALTMACGVLAQSPEQPVADITVNLLDTHWLAAVGLALAGVAGVLDRGGVWWTMRAGWISAGVAGVGAVLGGVVGFLQVARHLFREDAPSPLPLLTHLNGVRAHDGVESTVAVVVAVIVGWLAWRDGSRRLMA